MIALVLTAAFSGCPVERATYVLRDTPGVHARFVPVPRTDSWPSGVAFSVEPPHHLPRSWWLPWNGGTDEATHLMRTIVRGTPVGGRVDIGFYTFDARWRVLSRVPRAGEAAPPHLFIPELPVQLVAGNANASYGVARAFFDLRGCRPGSIVEPAADIVMPDIP